ncbi:MAG: leucine-rich repeat domain-containing protein [Bacteroidaceae bacterium]|nr:leucine-rich repeat domain-containing protein [Bacteroidaceae bacterium]
MKKTILMTIVVWMMANCICVASIQVGTFFYQFSGSTATVMWGTYSGSLTIPSTVRHGGKNYTVTGIYQSAFSSSPDLKSLIIPSTVTAIGSSAFHGCSKLESITLPANLTTIESSTFSNCKSLKQITIPAKVTKIDNSAFSFCSSLESISIPSSVKEIGRNAFYGCSLTEIVVPETVETIGEYAFGYNQKTLKSAKLPSKMKSIPNGLFYLCEALESVNVPPTITSIGECAFTWCYNLKSFPIPNTVTHIGSRAFELCAGFDQLVIPESVQKIGKSAFYRCLNVQSIILPSNLKVIEEYAFYQCTNRLKSLVLPDNIERIEAYAFSGCNSLKTIQMPCNLKSIGSHAFDGCRSLTMLELPHQVDSLSDSFIANSGVKDVVLHSVPKLAENSFAESTLQDLHLQLSDSSYMELPLDSFPAVSPSYSRALNSEWGTLVLPFDVEAQSDLYELYEPKELIDDETLKLKRIYGQVKAGTPVLVHMLPASLVGDQYELCIQGTDKQLTSQINDGDSVDGLTLSGTYSVVDITDQPGYIISEDRFWNIQDVRGSNKVYCAPFHAYFSGSLTSGASQFQLSHVEGTTELTEVTKPADTREMYYNLSGVRTCLPKHGMYVVQTSNGVLKKIVK